MRKFWYFVSIILVGGVSGILATQFLVPYLAHTSPFDKISWLKQVKDGTTIINKTEQVTIAEETAIEQSISRASASVVGIMVKNKTTGKKAAGQNVYETGFIVTSDGLVVTDGIPQADKNFDYFVVRDGQNISAALVKKDAGSGLALLKIEQTNLPVASFASFDSLKLGQRAVLFGMDVSQDPAVKFVDLGIIKSLSGKNFSVSIEKEPPEAAGSPVINVRGEAIGMAQVSSDGIVKVLGADAIKEFLEQ